MKWLQSLTNKFTRGGKADALYHRGMKKAKKDDADGAIEDYTAVINSRDTPSNIRAMAHFNRALVYSKLNRLDEAHEDLEAVIALPDPPANILSAAKEKLARWEKRRSM